MGWCDAQWTDETTVVIPLRMYSPTDDTVGATSDAPVPTKVYAVAPTVLLADGAPDAGG